MRVGFPLVSPRPLIYVNLSIDATIGTGINGREVIALVALLLR